ncbi:XAP5-domain-containing protein [Testicularia cyperi]|uniref:XAP5-domain-containing protein n=1 Tax=Testicularia cyperi TaxID=1882483 RepID=A0A317XZG6_9BASI|nr:XAP5-domain-containing protein [Testicularia cyperi]
MGVALLILTCGTRTLLYPYTKVEESFTIQAVHDILANGVGRQALSLYDHQVFSGAVPRSFIGPLLLAASSYPWIILCRLVGLLRSSADAQAIVRLVLVTYNILGLLFSGAKSSKSLYGAAEPEAVSAETSVVQESDRYTFALFLMISASQFHFSFWSSRTIPNSVALPLVNVALALVVRNVGGASKSSERATRDYRRAIFLLTFAAVVLRLEIIATLAPVGLYLLFSRRVTVLQGIGAGVHAATISILATTVVDTYFWQDLSRSPARDPITTWLHSVQILLKGRGRPLWPELEAVLFNVVEGKSSEWGTSPWQTYFTSFLPKLLAFALPLVSLGLYQISSGATSKLGLRVRLLSFIALFHTAILSALGHKEWRFVFYCLPAFNAVATVGAAPLLRKRLGSFVLIALLFVQLASSAFIAYLSGLNYPGGEAMQRLHQLAAIQPEHYRNVNVHIDVLPAMTGVTLFESIYLDRPTGNDVRFIPLLVGSLSRHNWTYDKTEGLETIGAPAAAAWHQYTHLISDRPGCRVIYSNQEGSHAVPVPDHQQPFEPVVEPIRSYAGLRRKLPSEFKADVLGLLRSGSKQILSLRSLKDLSLLLEHWFRSLLPFRIVEEDASQSELRRHGKHEKARQKMMDDFERQKADLLKDAERNRTGSDRFVGKNDSMEDALKKSTIGLVHLEEFQKLRSELEEEKRREAARTNELKVEERAAKKNKKAKSERAKLSFAMDDEDAVDVPLRKNKKRKVEDGSGNEDAESDKPDGESKGSEPIATTGPKKASLKNPNVDTSFLPDRDREERERRMREELRQEWLRKQEEMKKEDVEITYSYWDGTGHRKTVKCKKGDTIAHFLEKCRQQVSELRGVSVDSMMYIKEDLIVPHHYSFYDFIVNKARGKSGPLFNFDVHDDVRLIADASVEKDESHAGKVVERSFYNRNKHVWPYSRWEVYDPNKDYGSYTIHDRKNFCFLQLFGFDANVVCIPGRHGKERDTVSGETLAEFGHDTDEVKLHRATNAKSSPRTVNSKLAISLAVCRWLKFGS